MNKKFTDEEVVEAALCCTAKSCNTCPFTVLGVGFEKCVIKFSEYIANSTKNEPAPAATNINSNDKTLQIDDRTLLRIYQEELHNISDTITKTDYGADYILGSIRTTLYIIEKLKGGDSDTYDIIFRLNGKLPAEIFLALQNNLKCMLIHLRLNCSIGSQRYAKLIAYLKSDAKICGQADLIALGLSFDDEIDYRKLNFIQEMILIKQKYIKSPLNYVGGKYKLLPQILPLFPKNIDTCIGLFGGGFNVGINVPAKEIIYNE